MSNGKLKKVLVSNGDSPINAVIKKLEEHATVINNQGNVLDQLRQTNDMLKLGTTQQQQIIDQYRVAIYNLELRSALLLKMMEEKGLMVKDEFEKRWPLYLKSDVGFTGPEGLMEGSLKVTFYGEDK